MNNFEEASTRCATRPGDCAWQGPCWRYTERDPGSKCQRAVYFRSTHDGGERREDVGSGFTQRILEYALEAKEEIKYEPANHKRRNPRGLQPCRQEHSSYLRSTLTLTCLLNLPGLKTPGIPLEVLRLKITAPYASTSCSARILRAHVVKIVGQNGRSLSIS